MKQEEFAEKVIEKIDVKYVEEAAETTLAAPKTGAKRPAVKWIVLAASLLFVCLLGGIVFLIVRNGSAPGPDTPVANQSESESETVPEKHWNFYVTVVGETNAPGSTVDTSMIGISYSFRSKEAPKELTVSFMGQSYTGTYTRSRRSTLRDDWTDSYTVNDGSRRAEFEVNGATGKLAGIDLGSSFESFSFDRALPELSEDELRQKAVLCAEEWMAIEGYTDSFTKKEYVETTGTATVYQWTFVRTVQGVDTTDSIHVLLTSRGTLLRMSVEQPGWTKDHLAELSEFPVEAALEHAKTASGLTDPTVKAARFELGRDDYVFLRVSLSGGDHEPPAQLTVTLDRPLPEETLPADETDGSRPDTILLDDVPVSERFFVMVYPMEENGDMLAYRDRIAERIASDFDLVRISNYPERLVFAAAPRKPLTEEEAHDLLEELAKDPDALQVYRGARSPESAIELISNIVKGPEIVALGALSDEDKAAGWSEHETLADAETAVGFTLVVPETDCSLVFRTYEDRLIEVIFVQDGQELYRLRKGVGYGNVSGDSSMQASGSTMTDNIPETTVGGPKEPSDSAPHDGYRIALRRYQAYSYSLTSAEWISLQEIDRFFADDTHEPLF